MDAAALVVLLAGAMQFTDPPARYAAAPAVPAVPPPATAYSDAFTAPPPAATANGGAWNAAEAANLLRQGAAEVSQAAGAVEAAATDWNGGQVPQVADNSAAGPIQRLGQEFQNAAAPIQDGVDRLGNSVRTAADNLGDRTGQLLDDLGRPLRGGLLNPGSEPTAIPPQYDPAQYDPTRAAGAPPTADWNGGAAPAAGPATAPVGGGQVGQPGGGFVPPGTGAPTPEMPWNGGETATPGNTAGAGGIDPRYPNVAPAPPLIDGATPFPGQPNVASGVPPRTAPAASTDPWSNSTDPRFRTAANGGAATAPETTTTWPGAGDQPPPTNPFNGAGNPPVGAGGTLPGTGSLAESPRMPAIDRGMFGLPANRELEGPGPTLGPATGAVIPTGATAAVTPNAGAPAAGSATTPAGGWINQPSGGQPAGAATAPAGSAQATAPTGSSARDKAAVILAWVLLFASVAGNVYLFWSYLDVRTKYRGLVRKTARAVGSRFSAA
jgi:hypothetical protein